MERGEKWVRQFTVLHDQHCFDGTYCDDTEDTWEYDLWM